MSVATRTNSKSEPIRLKLTTLKNNRLNKLEAISDKFKRGENV